MKSLLLVCLFAAFSQAAFASDITVQAHQSSLFSYIADPATASTLSGSNQLKVAVASGDDLLAGTTVLVGTFLDLASQPLSDAAITSHADDLNYLMSNFKAYGSAVIGQGENNVAGSLNATVTGNSEGTPSLAGQQLYYFVVAGTDNSTPAQSFATAFQIGIYYFPKGSLSDWAIPAESPVPGSTTVDIADLTTGNLGMTLNPLAKVLVGSFGPDIANNPPGSTAKDFSLASVPEPATGAFVLLGAAGLLARRRRPVC